MFATESYVQARRGNHGTSRFVYLQRLVTEYQDTQKEEAKQQIIANLANFAYDPYNYVIMKELNILDLFLDGLTEEDESIKEFAIGGICNCICDPFFAHRVLENKANFHPILRLLSSTNENTLISALTTLYYLCEYPEGKQLCQKRNVAKALDAW
ncbi:hypothetical protein WA588_001380 [Blastocystis sp. NMH]